jgi:hypothetical protein
MGYAPVFDSLTKGTLCGRWPDIGLWPIVLSLADRHGVVDVTPAFIAGVTGLPVQDVIACMVRFCAPDPYSRSPAAGGARLTLLDEHRDWGWQIVNHAVYREKARKAGYDAQRTESGKDADRKRQSRTADVPTRPAVSRALPLSDSDTDSYKDKDSEKNITSAAPTTDEPPAWLDELKRVYPSRAGDQGWRRARKSISARIAEGHLPEEIIEGAKRYAAFIDATDKRGTEYVKQACTFVGPEKSFLLPWTPPPSKAQVKQDKNISVSLQWLAQEEAKDAAR